MFFCVFLYSFTIFVTRHVFPVPGWPEIYNPFLFSSNKNDLIHSFSFSLQYILSDWFKNIVMSSSVDKSFFFVYENSVSSLFSSSELQTDLSEDIDLFIFLAVSAFALVPVFNLIFYFFL